MLPLLEEYSNSGSVQPCHLAAATISIAEAGELKVTYTDEAVVLSRQDHPIGNLDTARKALFDILLPRRKNELRLSHSGTDRITCVRRMNDQLANIRGPQPAPYLGVRRDSILSLLLWAECDSSDRTLRLAIHEWTRNNQKPHWWGVNAPWPGVHGDKLFSTYKTLTKSFV